ncbi:MAG: type II toxin-antitoxin system MqsA family antitoxin [Chlamydiae bacterium]|nr:type II toxin-antitoxin system MqsA family antitoxin [Chlamydiota bacterium]MBI3276582.1 type II toxin-antitoxin system MqsA family antitoxin [Chlamydiota bacterium]
MNECSVCHGKTDLKEITYTQWYRNRLIAVENVPASICENCGEEYFSPEVVDKLQKVIEADHASKTLKVPVFRFAS